MSGGVGVSLNLNSLISSLFGGGPTDTSGTGTSNTNTSSNTQNNSTLGQASATTNDTAQTTQGTSDTSNASNTGTSSNTTGTGTSSSDAVSNLISATTGQSNQGTTSTGVSNNTSSSTGSNVSNTSNTGLSTTTGGTTTSSTTTGTADPTALAQEQSVANQALNNASNPDIITNLINSTLKTAALNFTPTLGSARSAGLYNSSTLGLLQGNAEAMATSDAVQSVLNYQTQQEQIATSANSDILSATKGSTTTGTTSVDQSTGTSGTSTASGSNTGLVINSGTTGSTSDTSGSTSGTTNQGTTSNTTGTNTNNTNTTGASNTAGTSDTGTTGATATAQQGTSLSAQVLNAIQNMVGQTATSTTSSGTSQQNGLLSVICTELKVQGKLDHKLWAIGTVHFMECVSPLAKRAYWSWAGRIVRELQEHPRSKISKLFSSLFSARAKYIGYKLKQIDYPYTFYGHMSCWLIASITFVSGVIFVLGPDLYFKFRDRNHSSSEGNF